ncbi:MBL fold metallo-hydrolase [soil metagenome]
MELTKYAHACVVLEKDGERIVIDPGNFTPEAADLIAAAAAVLVTHDHADHFDIAAFTSDTPVYGPASVIDQLGRGTAVTAGDTFEVAGFEVAVYGDKHAIIWDTMPDAANATYLVDATVYHPGDSYSVPGVAVDTLLLPTSGPWAKLGDAIDFVRAIAPRQSIQIHELMASELGQNSAARMLGADGFGAAPFIILPVGQSVTL